MRSLLTNGWIIDGTGRAPFLGSVAIESSRFVDVGEAEPMRDDVVVDCAGMTIIPGLIDAHVHLIDDNIHNAYEAELAKSVPEATLDAVANAERLLRLGFTTVREAGTRSNIGVAVRDAIRAGKIRGPRVVTAGTIISTPGGLGDFFPSHVFERAPYYGSSQSSLVTGPAEARALVRRQVKDGVDWIKVGVSGTGFNPRCPADRVAISDDELGAVIDEAAVQRRPVMAHAESRESIVKAARGGVRTIEHGVFLDDEGVEAMLSRGVSLCPTLAMYSAFAERGSDFGIPKEIVEEHRRTHERHVNSVRRAHEAGIRIIAGGDAGLAHFPQGRCVEEVERYVELVGMSSLEALATITGAAAEALGLGEVVGTIERGKLADLVMLRADPADAVSALQDHVNVATVIHEGELVTDPGSLWPERRQVLGSTSDDGGG
jgi:imidazolonepropionase-like amidohydrolase